MSNPRKYYDGELHISVDTVLSQKNISTVSNFSSGDFIFDDYLKNQSLIDSESGDGVTHLIYNDEKLMGYYTLSSGAIPYIDRKKVPEEEKTADGKEYDEKNCCIPALEIKMFAIDKNYQNLFYKFQDIEMPVASWCLYSIINKAKEMLTDTVGFKALFLNSVKTAVDFYKKAEFSEFDKGKYTFWTINSVDEEIKPLYMSLVDINYSYDE